MAGMHVDVGCRQLSEDGQESTAAQRPLLPATDYNDSQHDIVLAACRTASTSMAVCKKLENGCWKMPGSCGCGRPPCMGGEEVLPGRQSQKCRTQCVVFHQSGPTSAAPSPEQPCSIVGSRLLQCWHELCVGPCHACFGMLAPLAATSLQHFCKLQVAAAASLALHRCSGGKAGQLHHC
jgi:hypothetical protein